MKITPEFISSIVNFYSTTLNPDWEYDHKGIDMRNLQVQGAAKGFNLLVEQKLALLADEVGMGKTIQSLAICSALWNIRPDAKILVLAPRDEIAKNWEKEYSTFIRHHYRLHDNLIKTSLGNEPVKKLIFCQNLFNLVNEIRKGWGQFFIGKISSFSTLMARKDVVEWLERLDVENLAPLKRYLAADKKELANVEIAKLLKSEIVNHSKNGKPYFDLLIIDEAHYFRNKLGDSLRVKTAMEIFGNPDNEDFIPLASKVLLLTATPNHSSSKDIGSIVSYFTNKFDQKNYKKILDSICIRRLRRLSGKGLNKYNYRKEIEAPSDFKNDPLGEMFFGIYQQQLAKQVKRNQTSGSSGGGISRMMKYLEGVEFIPFEKNLTLDNEKNDEIKRNSDDYSKGEDAVILEKLSSKYKEVFQTEPAHPKYDKLVLDVTNNKEKKVIFVRRIPSVFEIAKRIIAHYDAEFWSILKDLFPGSIQFSQLDRKSFKTLLIQGEEERIEDPSLESGDDGNNIPSSKILNLFKIIKNDEIKYTPAAYFRLRFNRSKPGPFAMFFSPAENYLDAPYKSFTIFKFGEGKEGEENYYYSALESRLGSIEDVGLRKEILNYAKSKATIGEGLIINEELPTFFTIFFNVLNADNTIEESKRSLIKETYKSFTLYEKEAFSNFIEKGILLASEAVVNYFTIFWRIQKEAEDKVKPLELYLKFSQEIELGLSSSRAYLQVQESILQFKNIYTKVFSINNDKKLIEESWDSFNNAQPIYPYNADNSNHKVLRSFNTPFFPDILVATSVLQEGVNLQYFCDSIYHYGMAWTPGDNEQRIGRIDRMFGKIERTLEANESANLNIYYPYLKDTIDEEHLARFVKRKFQEELLIDRGQAFEESAEYSLAENEISGWRIFLRKPDSQSVDDPFPVSKSDFDGIGVQRAKSIIPDFAKFFHSIKNYICDLDAYQPEAYFLNDGDNIKLLIDPTINVHRRQPVIIELVHDPVGSGIKGKAVYCLTMKTPLHSHTQLKHLKDIFYSNTEILTAYVPGVKLCLDLSQSSSSNWGIYMVNELPYFVTNLKNNPLSKIEIVQGFKNLISCADITEKICFEKDLKKEELNLPLINADSNSFDFISVGKEAFVHNWQKENEFLIKDRDLIFKSTIDNEKQSFLINHENRYVKTTQIKNEWKVQVAYLEENVQKVELELMEKHLEIFCNTWSWNSGL